MKGDDDKCIDLRVRVPCRCVQKSAYLPLGKIFDPCLLLLEPTHLYRIEGNPPPLNRTIQQMRQYRQLAVDDEFQQLMDDLVASLKPVGALELVLVEKIAVSFWRQRRLIRAEIAGIELSRRTEHDHIRSQVGAALGVNYPDNVKDSYLQPSMEDDAEYSAYCRRCLDEYFRCHEVLNSGDLERLRAEALLMFEALECSAEEDEESVAEHLQKFVGGLQGWAKEQVKHWNEHLHEMASRSRVLAVVELVKSRYSIPSDQELISRYQTALDNETYKAIRPLREAQEWRLKTIEGSSKPVTPEGIAA